MEIVFTEAVKSCSSRKKYFERKFENKILSFISEDIFYYNSQIMTKDVCLVWIVNKHDLHCGKIILFSQIETKHSRKRVSYFSSTI